MPDAAREDHPAYPLSFAQERLWFLEKLHDGCLQHHIRSGLRLRGELRLPALHRALNEIVARHASLRTRFEERDGVPLQRIVPTLTLPLPLVDLTPLAAEAREAALEAAVLRESEQTFVLGDAPLLRATVFRVAADSHLLIWTFHHLISDGLSMGLFVAELGTFYTGFCDAPHAEPHDLLPPLALQYPEYSLDLRRRFQGEELEHHLAYWRTELHACPALELPLDRARPAIHSRAAGHHAFTIPPALAHRLHAFNQQQRVTPFLSLLAAFHVLLARYTGQSDILTGIPVANRPQEETDPIIGLFINTLLLRSQLSEDLDFRQVVARLRDKFLDAQDHQELPFEKLVEALNPARDASRHPLFQAAFTLHYAPKHSPCLADLESSAMDLPIQTTDLDLELHLDAAGPAWSGSFAYNAALFDPATIERLSDHYLHLLAAMLEQPAAPVLHVPLLSSAESMQILVQWNRTARDYPRATCLHQLFEAQAARSPAAVALSAGVESLTYAQLDAEASCLARRLRALGVGPEKRVGLCVERSPRLLVAMLAILKAGGAYVPLDPRFPAHRLELIIKDASLTVLITETALCPLCVSYHGPALLLDVAVPAADEPAPPAAPAMEPRPEHPAYVLFTSGSTGRPKGVVIEHRAVVNLLASLAREPGIGPDDVLAAVTTISFDISVAELFLPLSIGARIVLVSPEASSDGSQLAELLDHSGTTILQATPATWKILRDHGWRGSPRLRAWIGGEALPPDLAAWLLPRCAELWNLYGPTETTVWSLLSRITNPAAITIGRPLANTRVYILDAHGSPVPIGVAGELWIAGDGLARGYHDRPDLTAERFLVNPFAPTELAYRSGDLCRWHTDGRVEFLGRLDAQIKLRGFRIEPGEIEILLRLIPGVAEAVAALRPDAHGENQLVAYIVPHVSATRSPLVTDALRRHLRERLPDYLIPAAFVIVPALPLTPNGKLDHRALALSAPHEPATGKTYVAPLGSIENEMALIWADVLGVPDIGIDDNFFDLGGHSLLAARLVAGIEKRFRCRLPVAALFQSPTVKMLAHRLTDLQWVPRWSSLVPLHPTGSKPPLFLLHGWGGDVGYCVKIARSLGTDQPVFGLQAVGLDGRSGRHTSVQAMAAHYVSEICAFQPNGPYRLGGYSLGGTIAYEVACQLRAAGRQVSLLALIDSLPMGTLPWVVSVPMAGSYVFSRLNFHLKRFMRTPWRMRMEYGRGRWKALRWILSDQLAPPPALDLSNKTAPTAPGYNDYYEGLASVHRMQFYAGKADVFITDGANPRQMGSWRHLARGGITYHRIPGGHFEVFSEEHLPMLAQALRNALCQR